MLGAHDDPEETKSFDTIKLLTGCWNPERKERPNDQDLDASWSLHFNKSTPSTQIATIHDSWSPSMETPKTAISNTTGVSSLDTKMNKVTVTSPGLFSSTPKQSLLSDEDEYYQSPLIKQDVMAGGGFVTGNGKKIKSPSKESMEKSNEIMMQLGFTTGSGKKIDIVPRKMDGSPKRKLSETSIAMDHGVFCGVDDFEMNAPVKHSRLHAELQFEPIESDISWKQALKCAPCRDLDLAVLSGVPMAVCELNTCTAADFCFSSIGFPPWDVGSAYEDLSSLDSVNKDLLSFEWVQNHYRWIVWKVGSLARCFPKLLPYFTPNEILRQLHNRYTAEIDKCKRSSLKLITERDDVPGKPIVLMICKLLGEKEIEVSDGWYSIKAIIDDPLAVLVKTKKLKEGCKVITCGASLSAGEPIPVLEAYNSTLRLSLSMNSTRRARWHTILGYQKLHFLVKSIRSDGGRIAGIEATVSKKYPTCFAIEDALGNRQVYSQREYDRLLDKYGSSPSPSQMALFKNSRVSSFIRLLLNKNTLLTVWSPEMLADIQEGDLIRLFGAIPSKHNSDGNLNINTIKGSVIVKVKSGESLRKIYTLLPEKDDFPKELDFTCALSTEPDEASQRSMSLFVKDIEDQEMCILVPKRYFDTLPKLRLKQTITFYDLLFMHYDRQKMLPVYTYTERSDFKLKR